MQITKLDKLIWRLILGGMLVFTLGLFMQRGGGGTLGWVVLAAGAVAAVVGMALIFVRARMPEPDDSGS